MAIVLTALLCFSTLFVGCSKSSGTTGKATIHLATWAGSQESKEMQKIIDKLNAKSSTYKIVQESNPADYDTRIKTQLSGSSGPDIFWVTAQNASQLASRGAMLDITDMLKKSSNAAAKTSDYIGTTLEPFTVNGKIYGLPWCEQPLVVYYNKDMFDKAGVAEPTDNWNWNTFMEDAEKLTIDKNGKHYGEAGFDKSNVVQWGTTLNGWPPVQLFIWQNNGEVITKNFKDSPIDTKEALGGFQFYSNLISSPMVPSQQEIKDHGFDTMFKEGQIAMFMGGAADSLETQVKFSCKLFQVPAGLTGTKATFGDEYGMAINNSTKNKDAAFQAFIDLTEATQNWKVMPPRKSLNSVQAMDKLHPDRAASMPEIVKSMSFARQYRYYDNYADWDDVFENEIMDKIINGTAGNIDSLVKTAKPHLIAKLKK